MASQDVDMVDGGNINKFHIADASMLERELNEKYVPGILEIRCILTE